MKPLNSRFLSTIAGCLTVFLSASPAAVADDSEVFTSSSFTTGAGVRPNVLFIIDTSGSMDGAVNVYDSAVTYAGSCDTTLIYWQTGNNWRPPDCTTNQTLTTTANRCRAGYTGMLNNGWWRGRVQQLNGTASAWQDAVAGQPNRAIECESDDGLHGDLLGSVAPGSENKRARNGTQTGRANRWGNDGSTNKINWTNRQRLSLYSGNYANWYFGGATGSQKTRLEIVRDVAKSLIDSLQGVNLGLMRYSNNGGSTYETTAEGGMITYPISELTATTRAEMKAELDSYVPAGNTPLSETLYEAYQYLSGGTVKYGDTSRLNAGAPYPSVPGSRVGNDASSTQYESPMDFSCQKTFIVYLTDGLPTADNSADADIAALPDFATDGFVATADGGGGASCPATGPDGSTNGRCLVNLAGYMQRHDLRAVPTGLQNVTTYVVGFGDDIATSADFLDNVAAAGGGRAFTQNDEAGLKAALEEIFADVAIGANTTFVSPTVAVNAFNRTRNLNSLFVSVFAPSSRLHWPGNLKKYQLINGRIHGADILNPAVDPATGFFTTGSRDLFNTGPADGPDVTRGGAASRLPDWGTGAGSRKLYTYSGASADLTASTNAVTDANLLLSSVSMGQSATATAAERTALIEFIRGRDLNDDDDDLSVSDSRLALGDPMRVRPAVAIYGGTEAAPIGTVFMPTNDGVLHAFDMQTGEELWGFIPPEFLLRQQALFNNPPSPARQYALDGDVRIFKYDINGDGIINGSDKMYAIFGFGRGGSAYYALDVTSQNSPRFLWRKNDIALSKLGQAWSAPVITRVNVNSALQTDPQKFVLIFGGGYDSSQEAYAYTTDGVGNAIYMLELTTGNVLWTGSVTGTVGANFTHDKMTNSIPSDVTVLDLDGDSYGDRMYVGDMGGRIWRFDIWHGQAPATLVSGGLFATLGAGELASPPDLADTRRFYYAPDVSVVTPRGSRPYLNLAIGSGYRGHPLETDNQDRFYSLRDYDAFNRRTTASYSAPWTPVLDSELVDITDDVDTAVVDGVKGWKLELRIDGWRGEKVLAESVTANGVIFFPTFTPRGADPSNPCLAQTLNRTYAVYMDSGKPFGLRDSPTPGGDPPVDSPVDRFIDLQQGGIAPGLAIVQTPEHGTLCLEGVESLGRCVDIGDVVRTFWERHQ